MEEKISEERITEGKVPEEQVEEKANKLGDKKLLYVAGIIILFFVGFLGIKTFYDPTGKTIEDIRTETLEGEESEDNFIYNGYVFVKAGDMWYTEWQKDNNLFNIVLRFNPKEVEEIPIEGAISDAFKQPEMYFTFDPTGAELNYVTLAWAELGQSLAKAQNIKVTPACTNKIDEDDPDDPCATRPIITCDNTEDAVIFFKTDPDAKVVLDGNCMTIQGSEFELIKAVDKVLYLWYGIMK